MQKENLDLVMKILTRLNSASYFGRSYHQALFLHLFQILTLLILMKSIRKKQVQSIVKN